MRNTKRALAQYQRAAEGPDLKPRPQRAAPSSALSISLQNSQHSTGVNEMQTLADQSQAVRSLPKSVEEGRAEGIRAVMEEVKEIMKGASQPLNEELPEKPSPFEGFKRTPGRREIERRGELTSYAQRYAEKLGYSIDEEQGKKVLQDTVNFYSRSEELAKTLESLVRSL